jgi:hypothetical protein
MQPAFAHKTRCSAAEAMAVAGLAVRIGAVRPRPLPASRPTIRFQKLQRLGIEGSAAPAIASERAIYHQENLALLDLPKIHSSARPNTQELP